MYVHDLRPEIIRNVDACTGGFLAVLIYPQVRMRARLPSAWPWLACCLATRSKARTDPPPRAARRL